MRIAIVEDIASERDALQKRVRAQLSRLALTAKVYPFAGGGDFLAAAQKERFQLVFLDIYMGGENGVDTARALRQFDTDCLLVFTTTSTDHALEGFRVRAFHYLVKPYSDAELDALFDEIARRLPSEDRYVAVNTLSGGMRLRFGEILYAAHYQHQVHIYRADGQEIVTRTTFRDFCACFADDTRFFLCSRGVLVNLEHAADFDGLDFILRNGMRVPVSRDLSKAARAAFGDFLFEQGMEHDG